MCCSSNSNKGHKTGGSTQVRCIAIAVVPLGKEHYSHCSWLYTTVMLCRLHVDGMCLSAGEERQKPQLTLKTGVPTG